MSGFERTPLLLAAQAVVGEALTSGPRSGFDLSSKKKWQIMAGCLGATFLGAVDTTIVATLVAPIASSFHASNQASWLGTGFLLSNIAFTPLFGRLCDILGRRTANALAIGLFTIGTFLCAIAPSMKWLIAARFIAGAGGGGMSTTSTVISADLFTLRQRGLVMAISVPVWAVGQALGGPLGGLITDTWGWRAAFIFQVPLLLIALTSGLVQIDYPVASARTESLKVKLARIDFAGVVTLLLGFGSFLLSLSLRENQQLPWSNPWVITSTALAPFFWIMFLLAEGFVAKEPILPFRLLKHRTSLLVFIVTICVAVSNFGVMYNLPIWFIVDGLSVSGAGAHLLPTSLGTVVGGSLAGFVISRTGKYHGTSVVAGIFAVLGVFLIANLSPGSSNFMKWFSNFPVGLGFSFILNTSFIALMASVPHSDIPAVTGVQWLFRTCGQVFGVASTAAILQGVLSTELNLHITGPNARKIIKSIREDSSVIERLSPALQLIARQAYRVALRNVFYFALLFAFLAWLSNAFIPNLDLDGKVEPTSVTPPQEQEEV